MPKIYMIRHAKSNAGWGEHADPGLDDTGRTQADALIRVFATGPVYPIVTSPLLRAQETAMPLCNYWQTTATIEPDIAEIPSPPDLTLAERPAWLRQALAFNWSNLPSAIQSWRAGIIRCILSQTEDVLMVSHYVAINAAVGEALDDDRCSIFKPDHCSVTCFFTEGDKLTLIAEGREAGTEIG